MNNAEAERQRKIDEERRAKLDEIAEKQRQRERELEEKERKRRESLLGRSSNGLSEPTVGSHPLEPGAVAPATATTTASAAAATTASAAAATAGKYVPKFRRERTEDSGQAPPSEPDRWGSSRQDDPTSQPSDRWRTEDRRPSFGGGGSRSTWSSSRIPPRGGSGR